MANYLSKKKEPTECAESKNPNLNMASYNELQFDWEMFLENVRGSRNGTTVGEFKI